MKDKKVVIPHSSPRDIQFVSDVSKMVLHGEILSPRSPLLTKGGAISMPIPSATLVLRDPRRVTQPTTCQTTCVELQAILSLTFSSLRKEKVNPFNRDIPI